MSFNEITLPNAVIAEFYRSVLVDLPGKNQRAVKERPKEPADLKPLPYLGANQKHVVILVHYPQEEFLPAVQLEFLTVILKACLLGIEDIAIVNTADLPVHVDEVVRQLNPKFILLFGKQEFAMGGHDSFLNFDVVQVNGISILRSPHLENLNQHDNECKILKKKLWECLKHLFHI